MCALLLVASFTAVAQDSPLVALAKRTNRKASKSKVITNETLVTASSRGRVSVATGDTSAPPPPPAEVTPAGQRSYVVSSTPAAPREIAPEPTYPAASVRNIDPASSARSVAPASTARSVDASNGVRYIDPQSTSRTIQPGSSAQNIQPQSTQPQGNRPPR